MAYLTTVPNKGRFINLNGQLAKVKTLDEGRSLWCRLRDAHGLGSSDCVRGCGDYFEEGVKKAHVSFNGRMWTPEPFPACTEIR